MKGFFGSNGRFYTKAQRMAMFARLSPRKMKTLLEDDPKEAKVSDRLAEVFGDIMPKKEVTYRRGEFALNTGGSAGGSVAHLFLTRPVAQEVELNRGLVSYEIYK